MFLVLLSLVNPLIFLFLMLCRLDLMICWFLFCCFLCLANFLTFLELEVIYGFYCLSCHLFYWKYSMYLKVICLNLTFRFVELRLNFNFFRFKYFFIICFELIMLQDLLFTEYYLKIFMLKTLKVLWKYFDDIQLPMLFFSFLLNLLLKMPKVFLLSLVLYLLLHHSHQF